MQGLAALPNLSAYLIARGRRAPAGDRRAQGDAALEAFITALWGDATDFVYERERFDQVYAELEEAVYDGCSLSVVLAPVEGLVIDTDEVALGEGLALVRGTTLLNTPTDLHGDDYATIAVLHLESAPGESPALESAGRRLRRLQTALRLWDDAEPSLAPVAWARTDGGPWMSVPLATGLRRMDGDCLLTPEEEDPLRAFCALDRPPHPARGRAGVGAAPLRAGLRALSPWEALSDWLLAARALLGEPEAGATSGCASGSPRSARRLRSATAWCAACATRSRSSARRSPGGCRRIRRSRRTSRTSARTCGRSSATSSAATSTPRCAPSPTGCSTEQPAEPTAF